jgi:hypothetical protein
MKLVNAEPIPYKNAVVKLLTIVKELFYDDKITEEVTQFKVERDVYKFTGGFKISTKIGFKEEFTIFKRYNEDFTIKVRYLDDCLYLSMMNFKCVDDMKNLYVKNSNLIFSKYFYTFFQDLHDTLLKEFPEECEDLYCKK